MMTTNRTNDEIPTAASRNRAGAWFLAAGTFVAGLLIGAVVVGLFSEGSPVQSAAAGDRTSSSASATAASPEGTSAAGATAKLNVSAACLQALSDAQEAASSINAIADAARNLDARRLDEIVRSLQPLEQRLTNDIDACKVTTELPNGVIISGATTPAPVESSQTPAAPTS